MEIVGNAHPSKTNILFLSDRRSRESLQYCSMSHTGKKNILSVILYDGKDVFRFPGSQVTCVRVQFHVGGIVIQSHIDGLALNDSLKVLVRIG